MFVYDEMLRNGIKISEIVERTGVAKSTAYLLINDIECYISDFFRCDMEVVKENGLYKIKVNNI